MIINKSKYNIQNLTNTLIPVKWGVEAVWCLLTPQNIGPDNKIQHIVCSAIYSKPDSKHKTDLLDHISEAYHVLNSKFKKGLHFIIAGDTNHLKLNSILDLNSNLVQIVKQSTRCDKRTGAESTQWLCLYPHIIRTLCIWTHLMLIVIKMVRNLTTG